MKYHIKTQKKIIQNISPFTKVLSHPFKADSSKREQIGYHNSSSPFLLVFHTKRDRIIMQNTGALGVVHSDVTNIDEHNDDENIVVDVDGELMASNIQHNQHYHHRQYRKHNGLSNSESDTSFIQIRLRNQLNCNKVHSGYVKRKAWTINRSMNTTSSWSTLLLVLVCLVVKLESNVVTGALTKNLNYYTNSSYTESLDDIDRDNNELYLTAIPTSSGNSSSEFSGKISRNGRRAAIYQNEFAVYVPDGWHTATEIADKYGFTNMGQVRDIYTITHIYLYLRYKINNHFFTTFQRCCYYFYHYYIFFYCCHIDRHLFHISCLHACPPRSQRTRF